MYPSIPIDGIVSGYKGAFDWLHTATSRDITVFVTPHKSGCPNHVGYDLLNRKGIPTYNSGNPYSTSVPAVIPFLDVNGILNVPFSGGNHCPVCNNEGYILGPVSGTAKARIQWRNELTKFDLDKTKLKSFDFKVRIKVTGTDATNLLDRAERIQIDGQDLKMIMEKVPVGLRDIHSYYYYLDSIQ